MGQRTNIILAVEDSKGNRRVTVYHDQWGIGRKMPLALMDIFYAFYNKEYGKSIVDCVNLIPNRSNVYEEYVIDYKQNGDGTYAASRFDDYSFEDFTNPKKVGEFIYNHCDNNNGAMVVLIKEEHSDRWNPETDFKVGFLLGTEDECHTYDNKEYYNKENEKYGNAFSKWLSVNEYLSLEINNNYSDEKFRQIFKDFLDYFGIEEFTNIP